MVNFENLDSLNKNYTKLPNELLEAIVTGQLTRLESRLLLFLFKIYAIRKCTVSKMKYTSLCEKLEINHRSRRTEVVSALSNLDDLGFIYTSKISDREILFSFSPFEQTIDSESCVEKNALCVEKNAQCVEIHALMRFFGRKKALKAPSSAPFENRNNTLNNIFNNISLINWLLRTVMHRVERNGKRVELLRKLDKLQFNFGCEVLFMACLKYSDNEFLDKIHAPPKIFDILNEYIQKNHNELREEFSVSLMSIVNKLGLAHDKVRDNSLSGGIEKIEFTSEQEMLIPLLGFDSEMFINMCQSLWIKKDYFKESITKRLRENLKNELLSL